MRQLKTSESSAIFKALGDDNRLKIMTTLLKGEMCGCRLLECFAISQPTLSHHMKILIDCGLVKARKDGKWHFYSPNCEVIHALQSVIASWSCCKTKRQVPIL